MVNLEWSADSVLALHWATLNDLQSSERPSKRVKLDHESSTSDKATQLTLWDVTLSLNLAEFELPPEVLSAIEGVEVLDFRLSVEKKSSRLAKLFIVSGEQTILELNNGQRGFDAETLSLVRMILSLDGYSSQSTRRTADVFRSAHPDATLTRKLFVLDSFLCLQTTLKVNPVTSWSNASIAFAGSAVYKALVGATYPDEADNPADIASFYAAIKPPRSSNRVSQNMPGLNATLMQYQCDCVSWMIDRENNKGETPSLWNAYTDTNNRVVMLQKTLGLIVSPDDDLSTAVSPVSGGLVCDEMGLGKTVEILGCILSNPRAHIDPTPKIDQFTGGTVIESKCTLVICPNSILHQWLDEIKKHSTLTFLHYLGASHASMRPQDFSQYDVVVASYEVLATQVHLARARVSTPARKLRHEPTYTRPVCPLTEIEFWRVVMDEGQMIASGSSSASEVASCIPRVHPWICTGTPAQSTTELFGLLHFLRIHPIYGSKAVWRSLSSGTDSANNVAGLFGPISARNTKASVKEELVIPKQTTYLVPVDFTAIEETSFSDLLSMAYEKIGLDFYGNPRTGDWEQLDVSEMMRYLVRLRESCSLPFYRDYRFNPHGSKPVLNLNEVLETMIEATSRSLQMNLRARYSRLLEKARMLVYEKQHEKMPILDCNKQDDYALAVLLDNETALLTELEQSITKYEAATQEARKAQSDTASATSDESLVRQIVTNEAQDLRQWRILVHRWYFELGGMYYDKAAVCEDDSEAKQAASDEESRFYALAKVQRGLILGEPERSATKYMKDLQKRAKSQQFVVIPEIKYPAFSGGILSRRLLECLQELTESLNEQANVLDQWREELIAKLTSPLIDQNEDATGDEYQEALDAQELGFGYLELVRITLLDRSRAVTGLISSLAAKDTKKFDAVLENAPESLRTNITLRAKLNPAASLGTLRSIKAELAEKQARCAESRNGNIELEIIVRAAATLDQIIAEQTKTCQALEKEMDTMTSCFNERVEASFSSDCANVSTTSNFRHSLILSSSILS